MKKMKNKLNKLKKGFTIAELVVVIVIFGILSTLGFVGFSGYSSGVRDSNRISQLTGISNNLNIYNIKNSLPLPDDHILLKVNGEDIGYQGYVGEGVLGKIDYKKGGLDPKDDKYYSYYVTKKRNHFQLLGFLSDSNDLSNINLGNKVYSDFVDYSKRIPYVEGKRLGILLESGTNIPIQELEPLFLLRRLDLGLTTDSYKALLTNKDSIEGDNTILSNLKISAISGGKGCTGITGVLVCNYSEDVLIPDLAIVGDNISGRTWSDSSIAEYCNNYRNPVTGYLYSGSTGDGVYWIDPANNGTGFKVWCDMTSDGGGWTYATMLADDDKKNLFDTGNNTKITSIISGISTKGNISNIWKDLNHKDLMLICKLDNSDEHYNEMKNYETPTIIYGLKKTDINNLIKEDKKNTFFASINLNAKWNGNNYILSKKYGTHSSKETIDLRDYNNKSIFILHESKKLDVKRDNWINTTSAAYNSVNNDDEKIELDGDNYCMSAIR